MKRIYKSCVAVLLLLAMLLSCVPALAAGSSHSYTTLQKAEALKTLGLFQGTNKGFELEKTLTREQAITLIVRLLGAEAEAKEKNPEHPFTDVLAWASPYVCCLLHQTQKRYCPLLFPAPPGCSVLPPV